jgi:hypothetical protein
MGIGQEAGQEATMKVLEQILSAVKSGNGRRT